MSNGASSTAAAAPAPNLWIIGPWQDLLLFVATPLLILPSMHFALQRWDAEVVALFVASFGAVGHHLPGMMRAYGDRALFERFKTRFIVAPLFLAGVCLLFTLHDMSGIVLVVYLWGVWHGLMQTYGFLRIYDAKVRSFAPLTSRLDQAMCLAWFLAAVVLSPTRSANVLATFYKAGGPLLPASAIAAAKLAMLGVLIAVNVAFLINLIYQWRRGTRPSPIKLLLMATSFGFWWYANVIVDHLLVGIALFEVFHDVQYLAIVWLFNRKRASEPGSLGKFSRFLFRRSGALVGLYVGLVFAYGSLNLATQGIPIETVKQALIGLLLASTLLHFYYDGFIWKVREKSTQKSLGLEGKNAGEAAREGTPGWMIHGARWSLFVIPLLWLGLAEARGAAPELERARAVAAALPEFSQAQYDFGVALASAGDRDAAVAQYRRALALDPDFPDAHYNLGNALLEQGRAEEAVAAYREAARLDPDSASVRNNLGNALLELGRAEEAADAYRAALRIDSELADAHGNLGNALARRGRVAEALDHYRAAVRIRPRSAGARYNLARGLTAAGDNERAIAAYAEAVGLDPDFAEARFNLGNALVRQGRLDEAAEQYREALRLAPDPDASLQLGNVYLAQGRLGDAAEQYRQTIALRPGDAVAHHNLGVVAARAGRLDQAAASFREALRLDPSYADARANLERALADRG